MILLKKKNLFLLFLTFTLYAAPKGDFTHTLELAKHSSCSYIAEKFDALSRFDGFGNFVLKELKKKNEGLFPWRFEVTNGYQEGFVYYALLGYANELSGDVPFAYRCYQNSLACIDEDKSFDYPLPRAEIYLATGRTCLAAGRYMDAKDWLDTAFLESGDNKQLQAAIDRVLIQRANELGDYQEIIFLYQHLLSLANDNNSPPLKGETGGCKLTKEDYANYAQILFWSRKDREGFSKLLTGISKLGIDNNRGVKDPLVDKFLNNIMRADDDEVKWFYDLLGWAIVDSRAKAGDENYLAFLCNARTLFCKVYDFLDSEDDLKKVKERINDVKQQLAEGYDVFGKDLKSVARCPRSVNRKRKNPGIRRALREIINGEMVKTPEIFIEDLLMLADWKLKQKDYKNAGTNYYLASLIATGSYVNLEYDGTSAENAAIMGMINTNPKFSILDPRMPGSNFQFQTDNSYRAAETTLQLYQKAISDDQRSEYDTEAAMAILPHTHPNTLKFLNWEVYRFIRLGDFEKSNCLYNNIKKKSTNIDYWNNCCYGSFALVLEKPKLAFSVFLNTLKYADKTYKQKIVLEILEKTWAIGLSKDIEEYNSLKKRAALTDAIYNTYNMVKFRRLIFANHWMSKTGQQQLQLLNAIEKSDKEESVKILINSFAKSTQFGHQELLAEFLLSQGKTNESKNILIKAETSKNKIIKTFLPHYNLPMNKLLL